MSFLKKFFNRKKFEPAKELPLMDDINFPESTYIFLIGFSYDEPTSETFSWIQNILRKSNRQDKIRRFHSDKFNKLELINALNENLERVEIFCGHGDTNGLYGPPHYLNNPDILKDIHSVIYDREMIKPGPSSMFAFCCGAAHSFGREFSTIPGNSFLGFKGDVYFPKELRADLKYIFQILTKDILEKGKIESEHNYMFQNEIEELMDNVDKKYSYPDLMGMYLLEYQNQFVAFV